MPIAAASLLILGFALRLKIAWLDHRFLIGHWIWTDDSYLCMAIARNLATGVGMTGDGLHITNGFQPLYVFLLVPLFWIFGQGDLVSPIHWAGTMQAVMAAAAGWVYYRIAWRAFNRWAGLIVLFFWAVSHYFVVIEANGMETPLYGLTVGLLIWFYLTRRDRLPAWRTRDHLLLGVLGGLALLARVDAIMLLVGIAVDWLWQCRTKLTVALPRAGLALVVMGLVLSPWLLACWLVRGTIVPDSGQAVRFSSARVGFLHYPNYFKYGGPDAFDPEDAPWQYRAENLLMSTNLWAVLTPATSYLQGAERNYISGTNFRKSLGRVFIAAPRISLVVVLALLAGWLIWPWCRRKPGKTACLDFLRLPVVLWALAYSGYVFGWWYYYRYYYPVILIFTLYSGLLLDAAFTFLVRGSTRWKAALCVVVALALGIIFHGQMSHEFVVDPGEIEYNKNLAVLPWIEKTLPADARLGSFQSGIFNYFAPQVCVNLDGVVNHEAYEAMRQRRLWAYIRQEQIDYIVDWPWTIDRLLRATAGVEPVPMEAVYADLPMHVYRVLPEPAGP